MRLSRSFALKLARSVGACLAVLAGWTLLDRVVLTPAAAQAPPAGGAPAAAPPRTAAAVVAPRTPRPSLRTCERRSIV